MKAEINITDEQIEKMISVAVYKRVKEYFDRYDMEKIVENALVVVFQNQLEHGRFKNITADKRLEEKIIDGVVDSTVNDFAETIAEALRKKYGW